MNVLVILFLIFAVIYSCVSWLLPALLAWLFKRKFHIKLKIGRIAVLKLILRDVSLSKDGFFIHIDEVSFRSSFFNSEINKLVSVVIKSIEVTNNAEEKRNAVVESILKPLLSKQNSNSRCDILNDEANHLSILSKDLNRLKHQELIDFRNKKVPPSLIMFAQFMGVHIYNATITINDRIEKEWSVYASASEIHADGAAGGPARALVFSANLVRSSFKISRSGSPLAEGSCSVLIEGTVKADGPLNVEKIHTVVNSPTLLLQDKLYDSMEHDRRRKYSLVESEVTEDHLITLIPRLSPVIPKIFSLKIDSTKVNCVDNITHTMFEVALESVNVNSRFSSSAMSVSGCGGGEGGLPQVYVAVQMDQLQVVAGDDTLLYMNKLKLDAKLEKSVLNLYLIVSTLNVNYNHNTYFRWYSSARRRQRPPGAPLTTLVRGADRSRGWVGGAAWRRVAGACAVQGCAELRGVLLRAQTRARPAALVLALGCSGLKFKLDRLLDPREDGKRAWSAEVLADGAWVRLLDAGAAAGTAPGRRAHAWRSALLAVALVKWGAHPPAESKVEAMMDCLRLEWSPEVAEVVITLVDCLNEYRDSSSAPALQPLSPEEPHTVALNIALTHINLFLVINDDMCVMTRIDAVTLERTAAKSGAVVSGMKMVEMVPYQDNVHCQKSDEIVTSFFQVKLARVEHVPSPERNSALLDFQLLENVFFEWSPNLHLKITTFMRNFKSFKKELINRRHDGGNGDVGGSGPARDWRVSFKCETNLLLLLSQQNNMLFNSDDMIVAYDHETGLSILWSKLRLVLNDDEVVTVDGYSMERVSDDPEIRVERRANEGFVLAWNKVWSVSVCRVRVVFPYKHRFAEAVQGDFVSLFKWVKLVHGVEKKPFTAESPLPSDLHIKIDELVIEMSDDPFEVKLRDNYELLEDEYKESQKRRTMLDAKVQELCKPPMFLPAGKVEELYSALRQKDAQIYVQRCRAAPPPRTRLVACCLSAFRLLALADRSVHGAAAATARLREIDADSPWPEDGIEFNTLWCRGVSVSCALWQLRLRDFPQPLLSMSELRLWGTVMAAEETPPPRAVRTVTIEQGAPWGGRQLERSMMPLKWYYDLCCEMTEYSYAFGPCWEPVIAHCNLAFDQVSRPSLDPSAPLAWWDKVRLLFHGRLTLNCTKFTCLLHVSLDPYNTTEEMELTWNDLVLDWTNGKLGFLGELKIFVRTASKYDDCRVLRVPALRLAVKLCWQCVGDPRDHHAVAPCAPTRLPEYSSNQEHDSYRAFRSQGLDVHLSMDTKPIEGDGPVLLLYGSTLRWFESLKLILSGTTRPTRRGRVFRNLRPRKPQLSRHYRNVSVSLTLHNLQVFYWSSSSMQRGIEMLGVRVTCGSRHRLSLVPNTDALVRRARALWATLYMNCDLNDVEVWLKTAAQPPPPPPDERDGDERAGGRGARPGTMEKCYCVSVRRVSYGREASGPSAHGPPAHRLAVHDLRGAWTKLNRDLAFTLIDTYIKTQQLKKNLSTKALKEEERPNTSPKHQRETDVISPPPAPTQGGGAGMLAALVAEAGEAGGEAPVVFSDELAGAEADAPPAHPSHLRHVLDDDDAHTACLIELVNSQVVLKGCETRGYVILCAARAEVRQRVRRTPPATAWSGALSAMQYYATVSAAERDQLDENIQWVSVEEIEERWQGPEISTLPDVPRLVGSGHSAGGVIGCTVGPSADTGLAQLQRIVSRCACEFYYVSHEDSEEESDSTGGWDSSPQPYDSFTLMHHDLDVCTNSLQYAMLLDVVNNVVLHVEPERRRALERRARMRFQLQLHRDTDPRHLIHKLQTQVRETLARLRRLEKEYYLKNRSIIGNDPVALEELKCLDDQVNECKESAWSLGAELDAMVRAWREARGRRAGGVAPRAPHAPPHRYNEICFKSARWRLTDADGQLGIADLLLTNFLYTKTSRSDDSVEHQLEVGYVRVTNLLPNEPFPEVLAPQAASGRAPLARRAALRVFCRDRPPVGGISVKEHFEVNIVPIRIGLTKKFFNTMLKFCFPERDPDAMEDAEEDGGSSTGLVASGSKKTKKKGKDSNSNFYVKRDKRDKDDVEKMKERAEKNKLFIYIKIPEVPVRLSYKGSKEKNLEDVRDLPLVLPTLEYHNVTWTWLDLLLATKSDTRRVILSQAIRQKLQLHRRAAVAPEPLEEDKARLLLGERTVAENKPHKKSIPSVFKFSKS